MHPWRVDVRELLVPWADRAESYLKRDPSLRLPPQAGIADHLDLLERGWGWERLVPWDGSVDWSAYKNYLKEYHCRNCAESVAQAWRNEQETSAAASNGVARDGGGGLAHLVSSCVEMEKQFVAECVRQGEGDAAADDIVLSKEIQERAHTLKNMEGELFPVAAAALMCVTKKAELMCEWLKHGTCNPGSMVTEVRRCVLNLMMYSGSGSACAAAVMVGIAKETKIICECLRRGGRVSTVPLSKRIMEDAWDVLEIIHDEFLSAGTEAGDCAQISTVRELNDKKPDDEKDSEELGIKGYDKNEQENGRRK